MHTNRIRTALGVAALVLSGTVAAASHGAGKRAEPAVSPPPASGNRQSLPDADRSLERAGERQAEQAQESSRAQEQHMEHAPDRGLEHRNEHSMDPHGESWKNPDN
jgi:uncharacterized protein involved in copper resistance